MATELGSAFISVGLGTNTLAGDIKKAFGSAESSGADAGKSAGKGFGGAFGIAASALGALGIGAFFKSAVSGAADLEQSVGAIDSVFKGSAGQMHEWAQSAATDVGLSANEFNELGTLIGSQLKNGGTAMDELAPKTQALISTGADLASMFGGTTSEAVEALSSALKGERDPIERYGVSLNQAKIDAEAAALGFGKVNGQFEQSAQQAATLSLITKQTADATGNFGRETDTLAHKQQVLNAQLANGKARIGTELLPVVAAFTGLLSSALGPAINGTVAGIKEVVGGFHAFGAAFKAADGDITSNGFAGVMERIGFAASQVFAAVKPLFQQFGAVFKDLGPSVLAFASAFSPIGLIFKAIQPILPQIVALLSALAGILGLVLTQALAQLTPIMEQLVGTLSGVLVSIMPVINAMFVVFMGALMEIVPVVMSLMAAILPLVASLVTQLAPIITSLVTSILPPLMSIFGNIVTAIAPLVAIIASALIPIIQALLPVVVTVFSVVAEVIKSVMTIIQGIIQVVTGIISGDWEKVWTGIGNIFKGIWETIVNLVRGALQIVGQVVISGLGMIGNFVGSTLADIGRFFADTWNNVVNGVSGMIGNVVGFFSGLIGKITGAIGNAGNALFSVGKNIVQGLIDGIGSMMGSIGRAVLSIVPEAIRGPFEDLLGIHSPSRVFMGYGVNIGQGLINGLDAMHGKIAGSVTGLVDVPSVPTFGAGAYSPATPAALQANMSGRMTLMVGDREFAAYLSEASAATVRAFDSNSRLMRVGH